MAKEGNLTMPSRASRIAARLAGLTAAAEEKPPRDDLRKRYKEDDIAKEDRADYKDTHGDPDMKEAARLARVARSVAAAYRLDRRYLERDILKICENGQNAVHRYNENLYLVAEAKGNPRGAVMEFHWQNARGESFGLATVKEDRFGQNTPAQAANRLFNDYAKSSLRIFQ